jgi:Zn-dependent peptidase ImmA (M78 family)/transcriptional regulator with XRE-family HTH domain
MARGVDALINPEVLTWARESAGLSVPSAARRAGVKPERLGRWEQGAEHLTLRQLRLLAAAYHRPIAVFYLPKPPTDFQALHDFRTVTGGVHRPLSPELIWEIRKAWHRHEVAIDLFDILEIPVPTLKVGADISEPVSVVAGRIRTQLDIARHVQTTWIDRYDALNGWRAAIESVGVLVFQARGVSLEEMRAFSIHESPPPVVVLNVRDTPNGRVFSLLHELVHVMLHRGGVCDLEENANLAVEDSRTETFCNAVAGETLVPADWLLEQETVARHPAGSDEWSDRDLEALSRTFSVSREVILRRLLAVGRTSGHFYRSMRERFLREYESHTPPGGFLAPDMAAIVTAGRPFVRLVLDGYYSERLTSRDVSEYLGVRLKHLPRIEERVSVLGTAMREAH